MSTIRKTKIFSDINLLFTSNPYSADVTKKIDEEAIKASVRNLIQTKNFERPFHPEIGCQVFAVLFENFTPVTKQTMRKTIFDVIEKFEPRVTVLDVNVADDVDSNQLQVDIYFKINNSEKPLTLRTTLQRVR